MSALKRGSSLLWDPRALSAVGIASSEVLPLRSLFKLVEAWPDDLPSLNGQVLVVAGLDGCLDALSPADAETWLEEDVRSVLLSFQDWYQGESGLVFWVPTGEKRIKKGHASDSYMWICAGAGAGARLRLGAALWGGVERDARPLIYEDQTARQGSGAIEVGLHNRRVS